MSTAPTPIVKQPSFLDKLTNAIHLDYVLKIAGVIMLGLGIFNTWQHMTSGGKTLFIIGPITWFVGAAFNKIYK